MTYKEKIRKEVERLQSTCDIDSHYGVGAYTACKAILSFIDSIDEGVNALSREKLCEESVEEPVHITVGGLKEPTGVLKRLLDEMVLEREFDSLWCKELSGKIDTEVALKIAKHFVQWQKQQMQDEVINNYVECTVKKDSDGLFTTETWDDVNNLLNKIGAKEGDKVKLVIIKED